MFIKTQKVIIYQQSAYDLTIDENTEYGGDEI